MTVEKGLLLIDGDDKGGNEGEGKMGLEETIRRVGLIRVTRDRTDIIRLLDPVHAMLVVVVVRRWCCRKTVLTLFVGSERDDKSGCLRCHHGRE